MSALQPTPPTPDEIDAIVDMHAGRPGALLPVLHALQERIGWLPDEAVAQVAERLNISRAEAHGVVTFYADFRRTPPGRHMVKLCRAEACQARGGAAVARAAERRLGVAMGETRADGQLTLEAVYCLGLCAIGPSALVDGAPMARLDAAGLEAVAAAVGA